MDDLYSALVEGVPTQSDRQAALAAALRRQNIMGQLGAASGDRTLAPLGENLQRGAMSGANDISKERENQQQQDIAQQWHAQQTQHEQEQLAQQMKIAQMTDARQRDLAAALGQNRLAVADERQENKPPKPAKPVPTTAAKELSQMEDSLEGVKGAQSSYQPGFGGAARGVENWASTAPGLSAVMPDSAKDAQNWWANYGRQFTMPELKATVGLRHNQYMQELFESYHLKPSMQDDQIATNLGQIHNQLQSRMSRRVKELSDQGYDISGYAQYLPGQSGAAQGQQSPGSKYLQAVRPPPQAQAPQAQQPNFLRQSMQANPLVNPLLNPQAGLFSGGLGGQ
jgi:hypothetical protein